MKIKDLKLSYICMCKQGTGQRIYDGDFDKIPVELLNKKVVYQNNCYCGIK